MAVDWHVALSDLDMVADVTSLGRKVAARAAHDLEAFFGTGWLARATARATAAQARTAIAGLADYWPSSGTAGAYGNVIGLWASLQLLVDAQVRGIGGIRKSLRTNLQEVAFRHALTQVRLAAQAVVAGYHVVLEPSKPDGVPGDLSVTHAGTEVFLEIKTFNPDRAGSGLRTRLWRDLDKKARQTNAAGTAWVWVQDNSNTLWPLTPKVQALRELVNPLFDMHPHLAGVVLSSASMPDGVGGHLDARLPEGLGFRRMLPGAKVRESIVLHRPFVVPGQLALITGLCADEPVWLDRALLRLGIPGGLASLTSSSIIPEVEHPELLLRSRHGHAQ